MSTPISDALRWRSGLVRVAARALEASGTTKDAAWEVHARYPTHSPAQVRYALHQARRRLMAAGWEPPAPAKPPLARPRGPHGQFLPRVDPPQPAADAETPTADPETPPAEDAKTPHPLARAAAGPIARWYVRLTPEVQTAIEGALDYRFRGSAVTTGERAEVLAEALAEAMDPGARRIARGMDVVEGLLGDVPAMYRWDEARVVAHSGRVEFSGVLVRRTPRPAPSPASEA